VTIPAIGLRQEGNRDAPRIDDLRHPFRRPDPDQLALPKRLRSITIEAEQQLQAYEQYLQDARALFRQTIVNYQPVVRVFSTFASLMVRSLAKKSVQRRRYAGTRIRSAGPEMRIDETRYGGNAAHKCL